MKKNIAMILGIVGIGMSSVAQAEFIVIQESVAKDPYPTSFKVIQQTPQQQMSDTDPLYLQTITELDRLRAENVALRNQLFRNELGVTKQPVYGQATSGNVYRALSGGKFNITTKQAKALANRINQHSGTVTVIGYTDSTGSATANQRTGINRANSFKNLLVRHGAKKSKIRAEYRSGNYIAPNNTAKSRATNRRVQVEF